MKTYMHAYPEPEGNDPIFPFTFKSALIGISIFVAVLLLSLIN